MYITWIDVLLIIVGIVAGLYIVRWFWSLRPKTIFDDVREMEEELERLRWKVWGDDD